MDAIHNMVRFQGRGYFFEPVFYLQSFLKQGLWLDDKDSYALSMLIQVRHTLGTVSFPLPNSSLMRAHRVVVVHRQPKSPPQTQSERCVPPPLSFYVLVVVCAHSAAIL